MLSDSTEDDTSIVIVTNAFLRLLGLFGARSLTKSLLGGLKIAKGVYRVFCKKVPCGFRFGTF